MKDKNKANEKLAKELEKAKKKLEELHGWEERYKGLVKLNPQAVVTVNMKGVITSCNPSATKMTGIAQKNLIGKNVLKLRALVKQDLPRFGKILLSLVKGKSRILLNVPFSIRMGPNVGH